MVQSSPRVDSLGGLYLELRTPEAEAKYPGIRDAEILTWTTGTVSPDGKTWRDYLAEGTLLIGVGGGPLDEHPSPEFGDRKAKGMSTMKLVAKDLGLDKSQLYRRLIQQVTKGDLEKAESQLDISVVVKAKHRRGASLDEVIRWVFPAFDDMVASQQQFLDAVREARNVELVEIDGPNGQKVCVGLGYSENEQLWAGARYYFQGRGKQLAALVECRSSGSVQVFGNQNLGVSMRRVAGAWRYHELCARNLKRDAEDYKKSLEDPGQMTLVPNICYQIPGENVLNRSETAPGVEVTCLAADEIRDLVCDYIVFEAIKQVAETPAA
jgi:hypothetical protein